MKARIGQADRLVALIDGGAGLENCLINAWDGVAHEIVFTLGFWHASENLQEFVSVYLSIEHLRVEQLKQWCHQLKYSGDADVLQTLTEPDFARASPQVNRVHRQLTGSHRNHLHHADYPTCLSHDWQIGSGEVELACQTVACQRLKCSSIR